MSEATTDFLMTPELEDEIVRAAGLLAGAGKVVALTGAGLSVESGIPPFRGPGGLWTKYGEPPMDGYQRFLADPAKAWRERLNPTENWAKGLTETLGKARPNLGHLSLVGLEELGVLRATITQNVDDLHRQAGSRALLEIHGNYSLLRCMQCHVRMEPEEIEVDPEDLPPLCQSCGGIMKGDTVQFGEPIPPDVLRGCYGAVDACDCMLVVGTSATVYPAAEFPLEVLRRGGQVIEVNPYESELTPACTVSLRGPGGALLERLLHHTRARRSHGSIEANP
ncbi:MAG: NAD-dependent protein deacylase [Deltaproteobacteria bacterium]|jgi:NAD-dependent deacetylase|nr:NAD-dependent protein deacylase [Deltaproteobacteria bacterium]